jgi:hypothetical protein
MGDDISHRYITFVYIPGQGDELPLFTLRCMRAGIISVVS